MDGGYATDTVTRLETNLDDCSPELLGAVFQRLLEAGALDVWLTPIQMKKQRPGVMISALCEEPQMHALADILFSETTTIGLRVEKVMRLKLERRFEQVQTPFGEVTVKLGFKGDQLLQVAPEFESCRKLAAQTGTALKEIYEAAATAYRQEERPPQTL